MTSPQSCDRLVADLRAAHVAAWRESGLSLRQYCHRATLPAYVLALGRGRRGREKAYGC